MNAPRTVRILFMSKTSPSHAKSVILHVSHATQVHQTARHAKTSPESFTFTKVINVSNSAPYFSTGTPQLISAKAVTRDVTCVLVQVIAHAPLVR